MTGREIQFTDSAGYDAYMGPWSQSVGDQFIAWLSLEKGLRWLDVGCGSGAFTERILKHCAPRATHGIDPAPDQIAFAQGRYDLRTVNFKIGDAMALPYPDNTFDVAVMPLVIFFVKDPLKGVREMVRVVKPNGAVTAYGWDLTGGGFPYQVVREALNAAGWEVPMPPNPDAATEDRLRSYWKDAGLLDIETKKIPVQRTFASHDEFWAIVRKGPSVAALLAEIPPTQVTDLIARVNARLTPDAQGLVTLHGWANAVRGRVSKT